MISELLTVPVAQYGEPVEVGERYWHWARPQVEGIGPSPRGGHTATLYGSKIYVFGGQSFGGGDAGFQYFNDLHALDVSKNTWLKIKTGEEAPAHRSGHSASLVGSRVVFFGGKGPNGRYYRDLHALDLKTHRWFPGPSSGGAPSARHGHSCSVFGTRLVLFGGASDESFFNDLHLFDLQSMAWSAPDTTGTPPAPRCHHAAIVHNDLMLVHGGFCLQKSPKELASHRTGGSLMAQSYLNDLVALDMTRMVWARVAFHGAPPSPVYGHTLLRSENDFIVFGGWDGKGNDNNKKSAHQHSQTQSSVSQTGSPVYVLRGADVTWVPSNVTGTSPGIRYCHSGTVMGSHLVIFGGWDGARALDEIVVLRDCTAEVLQQQEEKAQKQQQSTDEQLNTLQFAHSSPLPEHVESLEVPEEVDGEEDDEVQQELNLEQSEEMPSTYLVSP